MEDHPDPGAEEHQSYSPAFYGEPDNAGGEPRVIISVLLTHPVGDVR